MNKEILLSNGFKPLTVQEKNLYEKYRSQSRILDICFPIMLAYWSDAFYRIRNDILLVSVKEDDEYIFLPPGPDFTNGIAQIYDIDKTANIGYMDKMQAAHCSKARFDARFSDYITKREDLISLTWKYKHKLSDYNYFIKNYTIDVKKLTRDLADDCRTVLNNWCNDRDCSLCLFGCEKNILEKYIDMIGNGIDGLLVYANGNPIGNIISCVYGDTLYYPYAKTDKSYNGLSVYMYVELAKTYDTTYVNLGSDGGFEGIKRFKDKFKPYDLVDKYFSY